MNEDEFPEDMGQAQGMQAEKFKIGLPAIMDEATHEFGQDGKGVQRFPTAFAVYSIPGQFWCRKDMKPVELSCNPQS